MIESLALCFTYWILLCTFISVRAGKIRTHGFRFTATNYYLFVFAFTLPCIVESLRLHSFLPLITFFAFGVAGMVGETAASLWWYLYFGKRFWEYRIETLFHKYTSWLNLIPWATGGTLFYLYVLEGLSIHLYAPTYLHFEELFFAVISASIILQYILFRVFHGKKKWHTVMVSSALFFFSPIAVVTIVLSLVYGWQILTAAIALGLIAGGAEYLFGKATEYFISKKLWTYTYMTFDRGHFTPLSLPLFALGGFYFWSIARMLQYFL